MSWLYFFSSEMARVLASVTSASLSTEPPWLADALVSPCTFAASSCDSFSCGDFFVCGREIEAQSSRRSRW